MSRFLKVVPLFLLGLIVGCSDGESYEADPAEAEEAVMSPANNPELVADLEATQEVLVMAVSDASPDQWTFRENDDRWNMSEVVEHLVITENMFYEMLTGQVFAAEPMPVASDDQTEEDSGIAMFIRDRSQTFQAPEPAQPTGMYATPDDAVAAFMEARNRTITFVATTDLDLRAYSAAIPGTDTAPMDGHQWFIFVSGHSARHTDQIEQIKADPGFPTD